MRKIRIGVLGLSGIVYRVHTIIIQTCVLYAFYGFTKDMWEWKWAVTTSVLWNILSAVLYYNYHYWFAKLFKIGRES